MQDEDETGQRARGLRRMQRWALALLLGMAGLAWWAHLRHWPWVQAFAEAALIGALADWFAVVALFRHPLGLPIPHTAIVPRNKARVAQALGSFIVTHFLAEATVRQKLQQLDVAAEVARWLAQPAPRAAVRQWLHQVWLRLLTELDDPALQQAGLSWLHQQLRRVDLARLLADGLESTLAERGHYRLLHAGLHRLADALDAPENEEKITRFVKSWSDNAWVQSLIEPFVPSIRQAVAEKLRSVAADESGALYQEFDELVRGYLARLHQEAGVQSRLQQYREDWLARPEWSVWWRELLDWLRQDSLQADARWQDKLERFLQALEGKLAAGGVWADWLNSQARTGLLGLSQRHKAQLGQWIAAEMVQWEDAYLVQQLELYLGRDLQFIRINGTLVGGLLGLLLHALGRWLG